MKNVLLCLCLLMAGGLYGQDRYRDANLPAEDRASDLLEKMTLDEKLALLVETYQGCERLGIPKYYMGNEALHGVVRPGKFTVFPQAIALASMWNPEFHQEIASAISDEARARWNELERGKKQADRYSDLLTFWSPTVNLARDPRWGRTPETYGEDPFLSGILGTAFVRGLQGNDPRYLKVVSTPKHFAANNEEHNRFSCNPQISERDLREFYLAPFERCIREGKAQSIMSAYNAINDVPCTANDWLLTQVLREEWGFNGYVVSDCGAVENVYTAHKFTRIPETAAALSLKAGCDLECGFSFYREPLKTAYERHMITEADIDSAAFRLLRSRMMLGMFDDPDQVPYNKLDPSIVGCDKHHEMALEAARQSIVLLKNEKNTLPLNAKRLKKVAVLGINADKAVFGDYSGKSVHEPITALQGIRERLGEGVQIYHENWVNIDQFQHVAEDAVPQGWKAEYFSNADLQGTPAVRTDKLINFHPVNQAPDPFIPKAPMSIRWTGEMVVPMSGEYELCLRSDDGCRVWMDDQLVVDDWNSHGAQDNKFTRTMEAGEKHRFRIEYFDGGEDCEAHFSWKMPKVEIKNFFDTYGEKMEKEVRSCDAVIAVLGINNTLECEGRDRETLELPYDQQQFIQELYQANKNTILVLVAGSSIAINWEQENLPAIIDAWYPGEQGGKAIAEVLFGDYNPGGRLPLTFYKSMDDFPAFNDYEITKGRTYQYFQGEPLYPFGFGLSYTQFQYKNLAIQDNGKVVEVTFSVRNTGKRDGDEISQVYVQYPEQANRPTPLKQLRGFQRTHIGKGKTQQVSISIPKEELRLWDEKKGEFFTPQGTYKLMVGKSSADIQLSGEMTL